MNADSFPTFLRLFRFLRRCLRRCLRRLRLLLFSRRSAVVYLILGTLVYLAYTIDRWHGRRAWAAEKERLAAAGESLDLRDLLPKRPPDDENFFAIPEFAKLGDLSDRLARRDDPLRLWLARDSEPRPDFRGKPGWFRVNRPKQGIEAPLSDWCAYFRKTGMLPKEPLSPEPARELLLSAERWQGLLKAMYAASERPSAVFLPAPAERVDENGRLNESIGGPDLTFQVFDLAQSLTLHGRASLETGDVRTALLDVLVLRRISEACEYDPSGWFFGGTVNRLSAIVFIAGTRLHLWKPDDLNYFENNGVIASMPAAYRTAMLVGRTLDTDRLRHPKPIQRTHPLAPHVGYPLEPDYWVYDLRWKWPWLRSLVEHLAPEGPMLRFYAERSRWHSLHLDAFAKLLPGETWLQRREQILRIPAPAAPWGIRLQSDAAPSGYMGFYIPVLFRQYLLRVACALERHYLTHRRYPAALSEISASLPPEAITDIDGQPFRYRTAPDGSSFRLWSVGLNGKDDTGTKDAWDDWSFSTE